MSSHTHTHAGSWICLCVCVSFWTDYSVCALQKSKKQQRRILCVFFFCIFWQSLTLDQRLERTIMAKAAAEDGQSCGRGAAEPRQRRCRKIANKLNRER